MASAAAQSYFNQFSPAEQERIRQSWGGADLMDEWFNNAVGAGAVGASGAPTTAAQAQQYARNTGTSEDYLRFQDPDFQRWAEWFDPASGRYRSSRGASGLYDKPTECPPGMVPSGPNETDPCIGDPTGGGGFGGAYEQGGFTGRGGAGGGTTGYGGAPLFNYTPFRAPLPGETTTDPSYQFRVDEGRKALERSASAQGVLRTSGTLKDILDYGQQAASQEYGNIFNRGLQTWGAQYQGEKDYFAPIYGSWQTAYGGDLAKYLQRENNIYGLLSTPPPYYG
ncbi:MAG: hypothetical protein VW405_05995 [Rhodospirillaceae bacterium]